MEEVFKQITYYLVSIVEMAAAVIIGLAAIRAVIKSFLFYFDKSPKYSTETVRLQLAAIAILRTALNYFIQKEIEGAIKEQKEHIA